MGHCAALISQTKVLVAGGFSPITNDFKSTTRIYDFQLNAWTTKPWMEIRRSRMDAACLNVEISNLRKIIFAGGWSNEALMDTQVQQRSIYFLYFYFEMFIVTGTNYTKIFVVV